MLRKNMIVVVCLLAVSAVAIAAVGRQGWVRDTAKSILLHVGGPSVYSSVKAATGQKPDGGALGMRTMPPEGASANGIIDKYGQYANTDWPGKIHSDADLAKQLDIERRDLATHAGPTDRDEYGGWAQGPQLKSTGFFRTEKVDGKWWLVTPTGHLFFSVGVDTVTDVSATFITGREQLFGSLPEHASGLGRHYNKAHAFSHAVKSDGETYDFYRANLERKYGSDFDATWPDTAFSRMKSWGFNTLGDWSNRRLWHLDKMPYTADMTVSGDFHKVSSGENHWGKMPDPFDPKFAEAARSRLKGIAALVKHDPWCLGYFVDNELSWRGFGKTGEYSLAIGTLTEDTDASPAKQAMIEMLKGRYSSVDKLNAAWNTRYASWADLDRPVIVGDDVNSKQIADLNAFVELYAEQYFKVVSQYMHAADPDHLYLGCRIAILPNQRPMPALFEAASKYCDVISFNYYNDKLSPDQFALFQDLSKPLLIGEFDSIATDHGTFWEGIYNAKTQSGRAEAYKRFVDSVALNPALVGCHWYEYLDQPVTGRVWDGENGGMGFVDVGDTPYPELVSAAREENDHIYTIRSGK